MNILTFFVFLFISLSAFAQNNDGHENHGSDGPQKISEGQYFGYAHFNSRNEKLALQADIFQVAPHSFTEFPSLQMLLKINLGEYNSPEYTVYQFKDLRYNFDDGSLFLDEEDQDLILEAKVHTLRGLTHLEGRIFSRSSNKEGRFELLLKSDEPMDDNDLSINSILDANQSTTLEGEYHGTCDSQVAMMQIQTAKGLYSEEAFSAKPIFDYGITARIGFKTTEKEPSQRPWTVYSSFAGGIFDPISGNLVFLGPSTTSIKCSKDNSKLQCRFRIQTGQVNCNFNRTQEQNQNQKTYSRTFRLNPTQSQLTPVPQPNSASDYEIANILSGKFQGFLHHENSDRYQAVVLNVGTRISSENPHNPNKIFISPTLTLLQDDSQSLASYRLESSPFYITPGFSLNSETSDLFITINTWTKEYIFGVIFSKSYGRLGTVELMKDSAIKLPVTFKNFGTLTGEFLSNLPLPDQMRRWFQLLTPIHPANRSSGLITIVGSYQHLEKQTKIEPIVRGAFDPYSQKLGWRFEHDGGEAFVTGYLSNHGQLFLYWPPVPNSFGVTMGTLKYEPYIKMDTLINRTKEQQ